MKILSLQQGSDEWLEARKKALNASEAPIIMGVGYISLDEHIEIAKGLRENKVSDFLQKMFDEGHEAEAAARPVIEQRYGITLIPIVASTEVGGITLQASFDGLDSKNQFLWEHKHTKLDWHEIPEKYKWQMEHQMLVAGIDKVMLSVTDKVTGNIHDFPYSTNLNMRRQLVPAWKKYLKMLENYERTDKEWLEAASDYKHAKDMADYWSDIASKANKKLTSLAGEASANGGGVKVSVNESWEQKVTPAQYIKDNKIDLPVQALEKPKLTYRVTIQKEKDNAK